jgi:tRNA threonylcarbamoyladenosine biosynthesis protein TsaE
MLYFNRVKKELTSEEAMKAWGAHVGAVLLGGEYIELVGDVGAGKTTFTKGLALGMGITDTIQSPTFTINRVYDTASGLRLQHYDFYRLNDAGIMADELAETSSDPKNIIVIEWGDIVSGVRPQDYLQLQFSSPSENTREVTLTPHGERSRQLLERILS